MIWLFERKPFFAFFRHALHTTRCMPTLSFPWGSLSSGSVRFGRACRPILCGTEFIHLQLICHNDLLVWGTTLIATLQFLQLRMNGVKRAFISPEPVRAAADSPVIAFDVVDRDPDTPGVPGICIAAFCDHYQLDEVTYDAMTMVRHRAGKCCRPWQGRYRVQHAADHLLRSHPTRLLAEANAFLKGCEPTRSSRGRTWLIRRRVNTVFEHSSSVPSGTQFTRRVCPGRKPHQRREGVAFR